MLALGEAVAALADLEIVGLGSAFLDVLIRQKDMPIWGHGVELSAFSLDGGGPVATAIVAAARLGASVGFVGTAGSDEAAAIKIRSLDRNGVDISHLVVRPGPESQVVLVYVEEATGERTFSGLRSSWDVPLKVDELDYEYITSAQYLHLDGRHYEAAIQAARWMHEAGKKVMFDGGKVTSGNRLQLTGLIEHVDILIGGSGFVPALTGVHDTWEAGRAALGLGPSIVVQTEGSDGSYTVTADQEFHTPAFEVDVVDTTGAGDVFHGAYLVGLLHGWDLRRTAAFAAAVSALKCRQLGGRAGIPRFEQAMGFLRERAPSLTF